MSQIDFGFATFQATSAISAYRVVAIQTDGTIDVAGLEAKGIGVTQEDVTAGSYCQVKLWNTGGTFMVAVTGTAVTPASTYTTVTGGYIGTTVTTARVVALESGVASNGIIKEFYPL